MRIFVLTLCCFFFAAFVQAQPWLEHLPAGKSKSELTLFDYQQAFESYWAPFQVKNGKYLENGVLKKAPGWKQFKRWEYDMLSKVNPRTGEFPQRTGFEIVQEFQKSHPSPRTSFDASWTPLGPTYSNSGYSGIGRLNCVAFHPTDVNTYWVGAAAGGLWMTTDNGQTWRCMTDNNGVLAVSDIVMRDDYEISQTIYIATGDRDGWDNRSIGVLKSTDGGLTWNPTGLSYTIYEGQMVNRLLMNPADQNILYAATTRGVYKTIDGGLTWNTQMTTDEFVDMEFKPNDPGIIYGSTKGGSIFISTDGVSFSQEIFHNEFARRTEIAVTPAQPRLIYVLTSNDESGLNAIYKSTDSGNSFNEVFSGSVMNLLTWESDGSGSGGQGWYDLTIAASPLDSNVILVGGVNTWRSTNGGTDWHLVNHWWGDGVPAVHADKHMLRFRNNGHLFECSDGGIYHSADAGTNWLDRTNGIQISQMYRLGVSQTDEGDVITGLQDNGTKLLSGTEWHDVRGGDGMECLIDYTDSQIQYGSLYYGQFDRTDNHWQNSHDVSAPDDGGWITPFIIDPTDPTILYGGYNELWKSTDRGDNWIQISSISLEGKIRSVAVAPSDTRYLYISNYNRIWRTTDGGENWNNITSNLPVANASIEYITVKHDDPNTVWVVLSGYTNPGVYETSDGGTTWNSISEGLPPIPAYSLVENIQHTGSTHLYLGTEVGVYFKNGGNDWIPFNQGLPNVKIGEIEIYYDGNPAQSKLRAATYGRGLWETPIEYISSPMVFVSGKTVQKDTSHVAPGQTHQEIVKVEVSTQGNLDALSVTSLAFNTNGSTDPATDITGATLFFTGSSNIFSTTTQFGEAVISPNGEFTFIGSQVLGDGKNNFWLTYDVDTAAILDHVLDAQCTSVTIDIARDLIETDPVGYRPIGYKYCEAGATQETYEYIANFVIDTFQNASDKGDYGYEDFTHHVIDLFLGDSVRFELTNGQPYPSDQVIIWADWNVDGYFDDTDEQVFVSPLSGEVVFTGAFYVPLHAKQSKTRLRVRLHDFDNGPNSTPCEYATWGEVEDYSIRVAAPPPPAAGQAESDMVVCEGLYAFVYLTNSSGHIQWQQSANGFTEWMNVTEGTGGNDVEYMTPMMTATTHYRAEVTSATHEPVYSNTVKVEVITTPFAAGPITGPDTICQGQEAIYIIDPIGNATNYSWALPPGVIGLSESNTMHVIFTEDAVSGTISVAGENECSEGAASIFNVEVKPKPQTPQVTINGNILTSDAPTGNQWYNQLGPISEGIGQEFEATIEGDYYVIVTVDGCVSEPSDLVQVIFSSVASPVWARQVTLRPNPVSDELIIEIRNYAEELPYRISNSIGQVIDSGSFSGTTIIGTKTLLPGIYYCQLGTAGNNAIFRFVKI